MSEEWYYWDIDLRDGWAIVLARTEEEAIETLRKEVQDLYCDEIGEWVEEVLTKEKPRPVKFARPLEGKKITEPELYELAVSPYC